MASASLSACPPPRVAPAPTYIERHIQRRDAARAFLGAAGMVPQRLQGDHASALPAWRVPGWAFLFDDADLMALARHYGWEDGRG